MGIKNHLLLFSILFACVLLILPATPGFAAEDPVVIYNATDLKNALENPTGSNIKLGADIKFSSNLLIDYAVEIPDGKHILDLNGFDIEYSFINEAREYSGIPIQIRNGHLTINGDGSIHGGAIAIEVAGWSSALTVNGGHYSGAAHSAIRIQGTTILNGGSLEGRFGDVWLEGGFLIDNAGIVGKIDKTFAQDIGADIRGGKLTGHAQLYIPLTLSNLEVPVGSSLTVNKEGVLNITGTLVGEERIYAEEGVFIKNGVAAFRRDIRLTEDFHLNQLTIESAATVLLDSNMTLAVRGNMTNHGRIDIQRGTRLLVEGDFTNYGTINYQESTAFVVKGKLTDLGTINKPQDSPSEGSGSQPMPMNQTSVDRMTQAANTLYALGLFQGTGVDSEGKPIYDLEVKPNRQVAITMLIRLLGKEEEARTGNFPHPFTDVDPWAGPYVGYAYANGLTNGISSTEFGGKALVSGSQYLTFVLRALGYDDAAGDFLWSSPTLLTEKIGLTSGGYQESSSPFFRGDVVIISERALHQTLKDQDTNLLQYLINANAVAFENTFKVGLGHLVQPSDPNSNPSPSNKVTVTAIQSDYKIAPGNLTGTFQSTQSADILLSGGYGFNNSGGSLSFNHPKGIATDGKRLLLADGNNNRVLIWNTLPDSGEDAPDLVLGQQNFIENNPGNTLDKMNWPVAVATDGTKVVVADTDNDRILIWNTFPTKSGQPADIVIDSFGTISDALMQSGDTIWPWGVWTDGEKLAVTCTVSGKAYIWTSFPTRNNQKADFSLTAGGNFGTPRQIISDGKSLIIGDHNAKNTSFPSGNFVWTSFPGKQDEPYSYFMKSPVDPNAGWLKGDFSEDGKWIALGETLHIWNSMPQRSDIYPDLTIEGYEFKTGDGSSVAIAGGRVYLSLYNGNKIVVYNSIPTSPDQLPDFAIGSPNINVNTLESEYSITNGLPATDGKSLFIASDFDKKLYVWNNIPDETGADPDFIYTFAEEPRGVLIHQNQLVLATRYGTLFVWNTLPLRGELPDQTIKLELDPTTEIAGVAMDDKYFYLTDQPNNKLYFWSNIPKVDEKPLFSLTVEAAGRMSSDGKYMTVMSASKGGVNIYEVANLNAQSSPVAFVGGMGRFNLPQNALAAKGKLFIADTNFSRVFIWDNIQDAISGKPENYILGDPQPNMRPNADQNGLFYPNGLAFDGNYLWVSELKFSFRTLRYSVKIR